MPSLTPEEPTIESAPESLSQTTPILLGRPMLAENGPELSSTHRKLLRKHLQRLGVPEKGMPAPLKDKIVKKTRKGPIGAIVVRDLSGLESNTALRTVRRFEQNIADGDEDIIEKLEAVRDELKPEQLALLALLKQPHRKSLAHLMADAKAEPTGVMTAYAKGAVLLGKLEAAIQAHKGLPTIVKDLVRHALDSEELCTLCVGAGKVPPKKGALNETVLCPLCSGAGKTLVASEHKEFAVQKVLEITKQVGSGGTQVNVSQQVAVAAPQGGLFEKMMRVSDEILFPARKKDIIEAEIVSHEP
jgi:hypothetical protein